MNGPNTNVAIRLGKTMNGFAEGFREEGMHQGKHQGKALVLERLLRLKFGTSPDEVRQRLEQADE